MTFEEALDLTVPSKSWERCQPLLPRIQIQFLIILQS